MYQPREHLDRQEERACMPHLCPGVDTAIDLDVPWHGHVFEDQELVQWNGRICSVDDALLNCATESATQFIDALLNDAMFDDSTDGLSAFMATH